MCPLIYIISCQLLPWMSFVPSILLGEQITVTLLRATGTATQGGISYVEV